jgi:hypothetical protein
LTQIHTTTDIEFLIKVPKICVGERQPLQQMALGKLDLSCERLKLDHSLSLCTSVSSKWIKYFNVRSETVKFIQENIGNTLDHTGIGSNFMNGTQ